MQGADLEALAYNGRWLPPWFQQVPAFARMANVPAPPIAPATPATRPVPAAEFQNDASIAPETKRQRAKEYLEATLGNPSASSARGQLRPPTPMLPAPVLPCQNLPVGPSTKDQKITGWKAKLAWMLTSWEEADWDAISHQVRFHSGKFNQEWASDPPTWQDKWRFCQSYQNGDWAKCQELYQWYPGCIDINFSICQFQFFSDPFLSSAKCSHAGTVEKGP